MLCQCLGEFGDLYWFTAAKLPYFLWAQKDAGSEQFAVLVSPFINFVFYTCSPPLLLLEFEGFDAVEVLAAGLVAVYACVDIHCFIVAVSADVA